MKPLVAALLLVLSISSASSAGPAGDEEDWSKSPEAYFLTDDERQEWEALRSRESRQSFIERYWLKRDPSPGTGGNEFQDLVRARIRTADARYPVGKKVGSRSSQGFVFIVFGTPARVQQRHQAPLERPRNIELGDNPTAVGLVEGNETTITWNYDRERTPKLLEALSIPNLTVSFVVEPNRNKDELQNPGLINDYREKLARSTIVNPDLVPAGAAPMPAAAAPAVRAAGQPLSAAIRALLEKAPPLGTLEDEKKPVFGSAVLWGTRESPQTLTWIFLPGKESPASAKLTFHALVRPEAGGADVVTGSEPAEVSEALPVAGSGRVLIRRFDLPPGNYSAALAVTDGDRPVASATLPLRVPAPDSPLAASSLLVSAGVGAPKSGAEPAFQFGPVEVLPRADAAFSRSESLWYFVQLANVSDAEKVTHELRLRHGAATVAAKAASPAKLESIAPGRYALGYEIPLAGLEPGSYVLYLTVRDGEGHSVLRRADFRVLAGPLEAPSR
jgi:GWxTD domain-containing protein